MSNKNPESIGHVEGLDDTGPSKELAQVDTVHNDEAMKVLAAYDGEAEWSEAEEKKLRRKIDWRLMPVLCATYGLQYYDKAMLSQAVSSCLFSAESYLSHIAKSVC